jgi:hypothetical protein
MVTLTYPQTQIDDPAPVTLGGIVRAVCGDDTGAIFNTEVHRLLLGGWHPISEGERR